MCFCDETDEYTGTETDWKREQKLSYDKFKKAV